MKNNQGFSNILLIVMSLLILGVGGYFGYAYLKKPTETNGYQFALHILSRAWGTGVWVHEQGTQQFYECKVIDKLGLAMDCFNYETQLKRENGVYKKLK